MNLETPSSSSLDSTATQSPQFGKSWKKLAVYYVIFLILGLLGLLLFVFAESYQEKMIKRIQESTKAFLIEYGVDQQQSEAINKEIAIIINDVREEKVDTPKIAGISKYVKESPLSGGLQMLTVQNLYLKTVQGLGVSPVLIKLEQAEVNRFIAVRKKVFNGLLNKKISLEKLNALFQVFPKKEGQAELYDLEVKVSAETIKGFINSLEELAKQAGVTDDEAPGDLLGEIRRILQAPEIDPEAYQKELDEKAKTSSKLEGSKTAGDPQSAQKENPDSDVKEKTPSVEPNKTEEAKEKVEEASPQN